MKRETISGIKNLLSIRAPELSFLALGMFGGEPLCAKDVMFEIAEHAKKLGERYDFDYAGNITTNAYKLDVDTLERCVNSGLNEFQVTLDGFGEVHDQTRLRADGEGTFEQIWNNLKAAKKTTLPFKILLRVHFSPDTYLQHQRLLDTVNQTFAFDPRFNIIFRGVERLGGPNDDAINRFTKEDESRIRDQMYSALRDPNMKAEVGSKHSYVCYASRPNSYVIRSDGKILKCTVCLDNDTNIVGSISPDGKINLDSSKLNYWTRGYQDANAQILGCPAKGLNEKVKNDDGRVNLPPQTLYQIQPA